MVRSYSHALCEQVIAFSSQGGSKRDALRVYNIGEDTIYQWMCDATIFNTWCEQNLLPQIPTGIAIIMDNAAFYKKSTTRELIENSGCYLLYLPTYSPDFNPVEHCSHTLKS
jgi:hypothetical protein